MLKRPIQAPPAFTSTNEESGDDRTSFLERSGAGPPTAPMNVHVTRPAVSPERPNDVQPQLDELMGLAYQELRAIAHRRLAGRGGTLSTTALVHEAYLKLADQPHARWSDRAHFLAVVSLAMRHVLVDCAKARAALKRGGTRRRISLDEQDIAVDDQAEGLLQLNDALDRLAAVEPRLAKVVECRFFGGLSEGEIADALGVTVRTVRRDWVKARVMLRRVLHV